ncbi:winged helix-turn-helix transcriptional regulator [Leucobacter sp. 1207-22]|uniref:winged helix-turn-helix transcriptional regulator n=1 Tax=Leucobacter sp. 1207-22 TaxID=2604456 RepID=UPI004064B046
MRDATRHAQSICPVEVTVSVIGGSWKLTIVEKLLTGTLRFGELRTAVGDITDRVLTRQLRELEADGIVHREVYPQVPPKVEYSLTPLGASLRGLTETMGRWGEEWLRAQGEESRV